MRADDYNGPFVAGDIEGLLRRGSPVRVHGPGLAKGYGQAPDTGGWHYPAVNLGPGTETWADTASDFHQWATGQFERNRLELDLSDATGRMHACWWLVRHRFPGESTPTSSWQLCGYEAYWCCYGGEAGHWKGCEWRADLPYLRDLDHKDDDRRLEDRSRWVDAEALRRIVLTVAGRKL